MIKLVLPSTDYKESYIAVAKDFIAEENPNATNYKQLSISELEENFADYVDKLHAQSRGERLPKGYVPATEYWIIKDNKYIGRVNIRHELNDHLENYGGHIGYNLVRWERGKGFGTDALRLALPKAKELGLTRVLITCDENNIASRRVIEKNGGIYKDKRQESPDKPVKLRYWLDLG
jgi:predicted acetyltransferase